MSKYDYELSKQISQADPPFYALIIILMIKPYGLFGTKQIERV